MNDYYETIDNTNLIENNLKHIIFELEHNYTSYFRIARESHHVFYRTMVESLKDTANIQITGKTTKKLQYKIGNAPYMEIKKTKIKGCKRAWRYSKPKSCYQPIEIKKLKTQLHFLRTIKMQEIIKVKNNSSRRAYGYLKGFYDMLAMIQTEAFMSCIYKSKPIKVTDDEMKTLEWLHERIRNEYEHFIPKSYRAAISELIKVALICIEKSDELINDSRTIFIVKKETSNKIKKMIKEIRQILNQRFQESNEISEQ